MSARSNCRIVRVPPATALDAHRERRLPDSGRRIFSSRIETLGELRALLHGIHGIFYMDSSVWSPRALLNGLFSTASTSTFRKHLLRFRFYGRSSLPDSLSRFAPRFSPQDQPVKPPLSGPLSATLHYPDCVRISSL